MARVSSRRTQQPPISPRSMGKVSPVAFMQEVVSELRKSVWPSKEETARLTAVVIVLAIIMGFFLGGFDRLFALGLQRLFAIFTS
jgi:preprotein translocase SecE subunit